MSMREIAKEYKLSEKSVNKILKSSLDQLRVKYARKSETYTKKNPDNNFLLDNLVDDPIV
jgi:predicted DNA-binding protein YlxM (UPF0122 family)